MFKTLDRLSQIAMLAYLSFTDGLVSTAALSRCISCTDGTDSINEAQVAYPTVLRLLESCEESRIRGNLV